MNDFNEHEGTPEESVAEEVTAEDVSALSDEDLTALLEGTPDVEPESSEPLPESHDGETESEPTEQQAEATPEEESQAAPIDVEKLQAQLAAKQEFIERRSSELGRLREQLKAAKQENETLVRQLEFDNPVEAIRAEKHGDKLREQDEALAREEQELAARSRFISTVPRHVRPDQFDAVEIEQTLLADGVDPVSARNFLATIDTQDPALVVNLSHRAYQAKALRQLVPFVKKVMAENQRLQREMGSQGETIAKKISRQLKSPKPLQASRPTGRNNSENLNFSSLSDADLDELIKKGSL